MTSLSLAHLITILINQLLFPAVFSHLEKPLLINKQRFVPQTTQRTQTHQVQCKTARATSSIVFFRSLLHSLEAAD